MTASWLRPSHGLAARALLCTAILVSGCASGSGTTPSPLAATAAPLATAAPPAVVSVAPTASADPLTIASWAGKYLVTRTVTKEEGFAFQYKVGFVEKRIYDVSPSCSAGPCDATVKVTFLAEAGTPSSSEVVFKWIDGLYRYGKFGDESGYTSRCSGKTFSSHKSLTNTELTPTKTAIVDGNLVVTELTVRHHEDVFQTAGALKLGCKNFSVDMSGTAVRQP